jgi:endonuclease VIII
LKQPATSCERANVPEGDTIFKTAATLRRALLGQVVLAAAAPSPKSLGRYPIGRLVGTTVAAVESHGKYLLLRFSNGLVLNTHLQMTGAWHLYRVGERWRLPRHLARAVLRTEQFEAVCFRAPVVQLLGPTEATQHPGLTNLGPDLLAPNFDPSLAHQRLRARPDLEIGAALLDQRALAGLGNVYKSEILFLERCNPFTHLADLTDATVTRLIDRAHRLLLANRTTRSRTTTGLAQPGAELWVYGRADHPCRRCAGPIRVERQAGRSTYWCPNCQPGLVSGNPASTTPPTLPGPESASGGNSGRHSKTTPDW